MAALLNMAAILARLREAKKCQKFHEVIPSYFDLYTRWARTPLKISGCE